MLDYFRDITKMIIKSGRGAKSLPLNFFTELYFMDDIKNLSKIVSDEMKVGKDESLWVIMLLILLSGTLKDDKKEKKE